MQCLPRQISRLEVDQGITQRDQFNSDEFPIRETLIREPLQNSLDGKSALSTEPVRVRISLVEPSSANTGYWRGVLGPLRRHLDASRLDLGGVDLDMPRILVIEDFGTTGLLGAVDEKDKRNFTDFWRRFGLSHKKGGAAGRWGLGKLVFSSASAIGTFFGVTVRDDDSAKERLLIGQAVLNNHNIAGTDYAPHVFFAVPAEDGFQLPEREPPSVDTFCTMAGITRTNEPGLSIAIVCLRDGLEPEKLLPHVITNYYFPILTSRLVVEIGDKVINAASFDELAKSHGGPELKDGALIQFIRQVDAARAAKPVFTLSPEWTKEGGSPWLDESELSRIRTAYEANELVAIRAPLTLRRKNGTTETTHIDTFLKRATQPATGHALFVRGSITIPGESRSFRGRTTFAALLASEQKIAEFLGDSENPAHTKWVGSADKLTKHWMNAGQQVAAIKRLLNDLTDLVTEADTSVDESALIEFFAIPRRVKQTAPRVAPPSPSPSPPSIPPRAIRPKAFNVVARPGGFVIRGNSASDVSLPYQLRVVTAYGVRKGNPFKKHKPQDFDLRSTSSVRTTAVGASWLPQESNVILVDVTQADFRLEVSGFDTERDLELDVRR